MSALGGPRQTLFYLGYGLLWLLLLPVVLAYLALRGRRDSDYLRHLPERFGRYGAPMRGAVWVHAVSLGELRSAVPLIRSLLDDGETVVTTHLTPAGRRAAMHAFANEIAAGRLRPVWLPLEFGWAYRGFFKSFAPRYGLVMEIEFWPRMIRSAGDARVPLYLCNAQYPAKSFTRDQTRFRWRAGVMRGLTGAFVKSDIQAERFSAVGVPNIHVTGELRFDQPIPGHLVEAGKALRAGLAGARVLTITSVVAGEDATYIDLIRATRDVPDAPVFIYVPRAPERFDETFALLTDAGLRVARRSVVMDADLRLSAALDVDVLLGDSMGEMYAYLAACDAAIIGGGFVEKGAHNISEPLALGKPVVVGPHGWTIEFPLNEALAAGVATQVPDAAALLAHIQSGARPGQSAIEGFLHAQTGAVKKTRKALADEGLLRADPSGGGSARVSR